MDIITIIMHVKLLKDISILLNRLGGQLSLKWFVVKTAAAM